MDDWRAATNGPYNPYNGMLYRDEDGNFALLRSHEYNHPADEYDHPAADDNNNNLQFVMDGVNGGKKNKKTRGSS